MISDYNEKVAEEEEAADLPSKPPQQSGNEMPRADIKAGPAWIRQFMHDFLSLRLSLQR